MIHDSAAAPGAPLPCPADPPALLRQLLDAERGPTAVEQFALAIDADERPAGAERYRTLLPITPPGPGQQYAFEVDLDSCSGCKACVAACHTLNGLDERETWRDVGLLLGGSSSAPFLQHVTTACHHCLDPACLRACPVEAYEKDPITGIVRHFDDQCFGCQYCTLACPYNVPKYHHGLGIVRKCDMCSSRLAVGEAPACVQSCPHQAIRIQLVDRHQVIEDAETSQWLPAAPDPQWTLPTTTFRTRQVFPKNLLPADYHAVSPQHPHWPLIVMLVLTQFSVGAAVVGSVLAAWLPVGGDESWRLAQAAGVLVSGLVAILASVFHLGRPTYAFRGVLGWRHSWLSREILAFGAFAALAGANFAAVVAERWGWEWASNWRPQLAAGVSVAGVVGVLCSVMIYAVTRREYWSFSRTCFRFVSTTALLGLSAVWLSLLLLSIVSPSQTEAINQGVALCAPAVLVVAAVKLVGELAIFRHLVDPHMTALRRSALLMVRPLSNVTLARFALGILGGLVMPAMILSQGLPQEHGAAFLVAVTMLVVANLGGELLERYLFFAAVSAPRMPGVPT